MPFPFNSVFDLLNKLEENRTKSWSNVKIQDLDARTIAAWFNKYNEIIPRRGPEAVAFLSCLFPERRPDRVFGLQVRRLETIIQRAQCLGSTRMKDLQSWRTSDGMDFASCVEHVIAATDPEHRPGPNVTLEELDEILDRIAATSSFSSIDLRRRMKEKYAEPIRVNDALSSIFRRLKSPEAKWMVRMLLKDYSPVRIPETAVMHQFHFLLPDLLSFQNSFEAAVKLLDEPTIRCMPFRVAREADNISREIADSELEPQVGVMIARPAHQKARSIKHCCQLVRPRRISVERKYDGEYCQIHIDLSRASDSIKMFSKSGKDSTIDRIGLHRALRDSLELNTADCRIKRLCILEGELLVWTDDDERIEPFHKIRKHVKRSGRVSGEK
jgi:DNA ligase-4